MRLPLLLLALFYLYPSVRAQIQIEGIVIDDATGNPLSFVNVFLLGDQSRGVITNEQGEYTLSIEADEVNDQLTFSLLGYQTQRMPISRIDTSTNYNVRLESSFLELAEVVVISDIGLRAYVQGTIDNIPNVQPAKNALLKGYSRQYIIQDGAYIKWTEAMVAIEDKPYKKPPLEGFMQEEDTTLKVGPDNNLKAWVSQLRIFDELPDTTLRGRPYLLEQKSLLGNYSNLMINPVRYHGVDIIHLVFGDLDKFTFSARGEYLSAGDTLLKIDYGPNLPNREDMTAEKVRRIKQTFSGSLLISKRDRAILRNTQGSSSNDGFFRDVIYQKIGDRYYVKQIYNGRFDRDRNTFRASLFYVTDVLPNARKVKKSDLGRRLKFEEELENLRVAYDPEFWEENSFLKMAPAPKAIASNLQRIQDLEQDFRRNARKIVE